MFDRRLLLASGATCGLIAATASSAQTVTPAESSAVNRTQASARQGVTIQEVVVTAQKRNERLLDVPMSVTAATGEQLRNAGITQVGDLQKIAPGFTFQPSDTGTPVYSIRGVGFFSNTATVAPTVGIYVDQVPLPFSVMTNGAGLDLQRVEILKGPQGTLFGENSTGGAINYIANKPTRQVEAGGEIGYGRFNDVNADGYISGPLTDTLSGRVAVGTEQRGPWQHSESRPGDSLGRGNFTDGRLLLDWKPRDTIRVEFGLNGWIDHSDSQAYQFLAYTPALPSPPGYADLAAGLTAYAAAHSPAPNDARAADWVPNRSYRNNDNFYQASLRVDWDITGSITLTSITSYDGLKRNDPQSNGGTNFPDLSIRTKNLIHTFAQELRLAGRGDGGAFRWMVGANYEKDIANEDQMGFDYDSSNSGVGPFRYHSFDIQNDQDIETKAVFGSLDYDLLHSLTLQGSVRYTSSDNAFHGCGRDGGDGADANAFTFLVQDILGSANAVNPGPGGCTSINPATLNFVPIVESSLNEDNVSWRVSLNWKPGPDTLIYGNVTQGYKAGAFNTVPAVFTTQFTPVPQESLLAYEAGFKQEFRALGLQVSGAGFYYDYTDKQLLGSINEPVFGALPGLVTVPKSYVVGAELAVLWRPVRGLTINAGATYVDSNVSQKFITSDNYGNLIDIKGEAFPDTPKWQLITDAQYEFPLGERLSGFVGGNLQYQSDSFASFGGESIFKLNSRALLDLRVGVTDTHWRLEVWGRNVTNKFYDTTAIGFGDTTARMNGMPATYGVTLGYKY